MDLQHWIPILGFAILFGVWLVMTLKEKKPSERPYVKDLARLKRDWNRWLTQFTPMASAYVESWHFILRHWLQVLSALIILFLFEKGAQHLAPELPDIQNPLLGIALALAYIFIALVLLSLYFGFKQTVLIKMVQAEKEGKPVSLITAVQESAGEASRVIQTSFFVVWRFFGWLFLIIPGFVLAFQYSFAIPVAILDRVPPREAPAQSRKLVISRPQETGGFLILSAIFYFGTFELLVPLNRSFPIGAILHYFTVSALVHLSMVFYYYWLREK